MNLAISFHQTFGLLQNMSVIQKVIKTLDSIYSASSITTITFCNNVSSIKREVRGKDSYILELLSSAADRGCLAAGMDFSVIVPVFARSTKMVKHILLSHQLKLDLSSTDIKAKVLLLSVVLWWGRSGLQEKKKKKKSSSLVKGLSLSSLQLGCHVSKTWHAVTTRVLEQSRPPFMPEKGIQQNSIYKN